MNPTNMKTGEFSFMDKALGTTCMNETDRSMPAAKLKK
jgi:hypothetical protein